MRSSVSYFVWYELELMADNSNRLPKNPSDSPLARAIAGQIEEAVKSGRFTAGARLPTERELSIEFQVSRATIRAAIHVLRRREVVEHRPHCRPVFRQVRKKPQPVGSAGRHTIALWLIHGPQDAERTSILHGVQGAIDPEQYRLVVENPRMDGGAALERAELRFLERLAQEHDVAGAIIWCVGGEEIVPVLNRVRDHGVAFVFIDRLPPKGFEADHVGIDNVDAAYRAVRHLAKLGHERIAHITNSDRASTVGERELGYRMALDRAGLPFRDDFIERFQRPFQDTPAEAREIVERLMALKEPPTALFVVSDHYALSVVAAIEAMGRRVPEDLAVVGFDGLEGMRFGPRMLTTIDQPFERMGARAVDLLLRRIHEGEGSAHRHVLLEAPLSFHRSSGRHRPAEPEVVHSHT